MGWYFMTCATILPRRCSTLGLTRRRHPSVIDYLFRVPLLPWGCTDDLPLVRYPSPQGLSDPACCLWPRHGHRCRTAAPGEVCVKAYMAGLWRGEHCSCCLSGRRRLWMVHGNFGMYIRPEIQKYNCTCLRRYRIRQRQRTPPKPKPRWELHLVVMHQWGHRSTSYTMSPIPSTTATRLLSQNIAAPLRA